MPVYLTSNLTILPDRIKVERGRQLFDAGGKLLVIREFPAAG